MEGAQHHSEMEQAPKRDVERGSSITMDRHDSNTEGTGMSDEHATNDRLAALEALLARQDERMARQEAEIERLRMALAASQPEAATTAPASETPGPLPSR